jgi:hypothetical protein
MHKIVKIVLLVIGLAGLICWFMLPGREVPATEAIDNGAMNTMFLLTYLLLAIAVIVSLLFTLKNLFSNPASLKKTLYIIVGLAVVVGISYAISSGTDVADEYKAMSDEATIKKIGMGLNVFFILTVVAVGSMLWGGLKKMTSK